MHLLVVMLDTEMHLVKSTRFPLNQLWISIILASFVDETFRVDYRMLGSLLGSSVMVKFKLHIL